MLIPAFAAAQYTGGPYTQTIDTTYSAGFFSTSGTGVFGTGSCTGSGLSCVASTIINLINVVLVPLLFAIAFIVFLYGIANAYILHPGDEAAVKSGHKLILWGVIGFAVMVSLWGLVNVVASTFGLGGVGAPTLPTSY